MSNIPDDLHRDLEAITLKMLDTLHEEAYELAEAHGYTDSLFDDNILRAIRTLICENI